MAATVDFAPGAEENPLARWAHDTIVRRVESDARSRRDFDALRAAISLVAQDRRLSTTLRFDHGHVTVHDGMLGIPDVTLCGDYDTIVGLAAMPLSRIGRLPLAAPWRRLAVEAMAGELKIYGLASHPRMLLRMLRLIAAS